MFLMMSRPCRKFRRLDSPIARVDENNGYGDDAALELALQASLEDAARATPPQARADRAARPPAAPVRLETPSSAHRARTSPRRFPRQVRIMPPY